MWKILQPKDLITKDCICTTAQPTPPLPKKKEDVSSNLTSSMSQNWVANIFYDRANEFWIGQSFLELLKARSPRLGSNYANDTLKIAVWVPEESLPPTKPNTEANVEIYL